MDREVMHLRDGLIPKFAVAHLQRLLVLAGDAACCGRSIEESQRDVNGTARIKLYKGHASVVGRKSPNSLYNPELAGLRDLRDLQLQGRGRLHPHERTAAVA